MRLTLAPPDAARCHPPTPAWLLAASPGTRAAARCRSAGALADRRLRDYLPATIGRVEIMGVRIRTIISDNVAKRCDGCGQIIEGTPWRVNLLDIVTAETPVSWTARPAINPGPFQFHGDAACVRRWMAARGYLFCRRGEVREIMRPVPIPGLGRSGR